MWRLVFRLQLVWVLVQLLRETNGLLRELIVLQTSRPPRTPGVDLTRLPVPPTPAGPEALSYRQGAVPRR